MAYLTKRFPRLSETFILGEILGLERAGVPLRLFALADPGESLVQSGVREVRSPVTYLHRRGGIGVKASDLVALAEAHGRLLLRSPRRYLAVLAYVLVKRRHLSTFRHFLEAGRMARFLEQERAVHLHAAFAHGPASVAHLVHRLTGIPFSFAGHAKDIAVSAPDLLTRKVAEAEFALACSQWAAETLRALADTRPEKVLLAYHGVDTERFRPGPVRPEDGPLELLAVGRLVAKKGYPVLLDALATAVCRGSRIRCRILGGGPMRAEIEERIARLGLGGVVSLLGASTQERVAAAYASADAFVQASVVLADGDRDGIPNSLLEAMASGLPVVASDVGGIGEVVGPECGLLVSPGDRQALAEALETLASDRRLVRRLGAAARAEAVGRWDQTDCARRLAPLFHPAFPNEPMGLAS